MNFPQYMQVKQFVAVVRGTVGKFAVFITGDSAYYLFVPVDHNGCMGTNSFPVKKTDLKREIRSALAHGYGNADMVDVGPTTTGKDRANGSR